MKEYLKNNKHSIYCRETVRGTTYTKIARKVLFREQLVECRGWNPSFDMVRYVRDSDPVRYNEEMRVLGERTFYEKLYEYTHLFGVISLCRNYGNLFPQPSCLMIEVKKNKSKVE